jgi:hypothetical protein
MTVNWLLMALSAGTSLSMKAITVPEEWSDKEVKRKHTRK